MSQAPPAPRWRSLLAIFAIVTCFYWKLSLSTQYAWLESYDLANQVLPWLELQVDALRHARFALWTPYEWMGQPFAAQMQPGVFSPFTWLLALTPLRDGYLQYHWVNLWFVALHIAAACFMWVLLRDLGLREAASVTGAVLFACIGFYGNTDWPQQLVSAIWTPLVFLYVFRALRRQNTLASACFAGLFAGLCWLGGYFASAYYVTLAAGIVFAIGLIRAHGPIWPRLRLFCAFALVLGAVSAPQILPSLEYGRLARRWTATGALLWNQKVGLPEHFDSGMQGSDIAHLVFPGAGLHAEPFTGAIALGLALLALSGLATETRLRFERLTLIGLATASLLFVLARYLFVYGVLYALVPMLEKSRAPVTALCIFHFAIAALAAMGMERLLDRESGIAVKYLVRGLMLFGAGLLILITILGFLPPVGDATFSSHDPRLPPICLVAILFAGAATAFRRGLVGTRTAAAIFCFFVLAEQGQVAGYSWPHTSETARRTLLPPIDNSRDLADFLRPLQPARVEIKREDGLEFGFGNWYRLHAVEALEASLLATTSDFGWAQGRQVRLFGVRYSIARLPTRPGQREVFRGKMGFAVFENPNVLPRAWTVHKLHSLQPGRPPLEQVRDGDFDFGEEAVVAGGQPRLAVCPAADRILGARFDLQTVQITVEMACRGLLLVSDNWYPGWVARVDGRRAPLEHADSVIRGVVLEAGRHTVTMDYRPKTIYAGLAWCLAGLAFTATVRLRSGKQIPRRVNRVAGVPDQSS